MKLVLVNCRMPFSQSFSGLCGEPNGEGGYLSEIRTRQCYCGAECYVLKSGNALIFLEGRAKAS